MYPPTVVESLQVLEDSRLSNLPAREAQSTDQLRLQRRHERFRDGVVQGATDPAHRRYDANLFEPLAEREGRVLNTLVGVMDQPRSRLPALEGHLKGTEHQLRPQVTLHRPTDEPPGVNIEDESQV